MLLFKENESWNKANLIGQRAGLIISYALFTTVLYDIMNLTKKIPESWNFFHIATITVVIAASGWALKQLLK